MNRFLNVNMRYDMLKDIHVKESAKINGVEMTARKALSTASANEVSIFKQLSKEVGNEIMACLCVVTQNTNN